MARDVADVLGDAIGRAAREAAKSISTNSGKNSGLDRVTGAVSKRMDGTLSGSKGLAAGVGAATLVPLAVKGAGKLVKGVAGGGGNGKGAVSKAGDKLKGAAGGGKSGGKNSEPGVGKGRRMPIQQDIDIGMPIAQVYKEWTNYEEWPNFMHRLQNVSHDDDTVTFKTKIWGVSKEFTAEIVEQEENERIKWQVTDGVTHTGVVTFHELGPRLTRMELNLDVEPGSLIEKAARGMRHVKRAVRADMARFKAHVLMQEEESPRSSSSASTRSSSSSASKRSSSRGRTSGSSGRTSSSSARKSSSGRKQSSNGGQRRSSSRTRASSSSNGRSRSGSSSSRKRSGSRS
jgi:uncharacterized membrane protein